MDINTNPASHYSPQIQPNSDKQDPKIRDKRKARCLSAEENPFEGSLPSEILEKKARNVQKTATPLLAEITKSGIRYGDMTYTICSKLGEGTYGTVYRATSSGGTDVAIKIRKTEIEEHFSGLHTSRNEIEMFKLTAKKVRNVAQLLDTFKDSHNQEFLVMPLYGKTLNKKIYEGALPLNQVFAIGKQLAEFLVDMKTNGLIHGDLKPSNIVFGSADDEKSEVNIKVIDFGSVMQNKSPVNAATQCLKYRAPEIMLGIAQYDYRIDMWSLGCILFELYTKNSFIYPPFFDEESKHSNYLTLLEIQNKLDITIPKTWYKKITLPKKHFIQTDKGYQLEENSREVFKSDFFKSSIKESAEKNNDPPEKVNKFIELLQGILSYERISPEEALEQLTELSQ